MEGEALVSTKCSLGRVILDTAGERWLPSAQFLDCINAGRDAA